MRSARRHRRRTAVEAAGGPAMHRPHPAMDFATGSGDHCHNITDPEEPP
jgi:hypothetical protein